MNFVCANVASDEVPARSRRGFRTNPSVSESERPGPPAGRAPARFGISTPHRAAPPVRPGNRGSPAARSSRGTLYFRRADRYHQGLTPWGDAVVATVAPGVRAHGLHPSPRCSLVGRGDPGAMRHSRFLVPSPEVAVGDQTTATGLGRANPDSRRDP